MQNKPRSYREMTDKAARTDLLSSDTTLQLEIVRTIMVRDANANPIRPKPDSSAWYVERLEREFMARCLPQEHFWAFYLDTRDGVIGCEALFHGTLDATIVGIRDVVRGALLRNAKQVVVAHNHPSGDPTPSPDDIILTRKLREACDLFDIELADHITIGSHRHCSMRERGEL
jgi:DNA repair protein RadC